MDEADSGIIGLFLCLFADFGESPTSLSRVPQKEYNLLCGEHSALSSAEKLVLLRHLLLLETGSFNLHFVYFVDVDGLFVVLRFV